MRSYPLSFVAAMLVAVACGKDPDSKKGGPSPSSTPTTPTTPPTTPTTPPTTPPPPVPPPIREFQCEATAVTGDTPLLDLAVAPEQLVLRPAGNPCENDLLFKSGTTEHEISSGPGMIVLAGATTLADKLVVCLSNEAHKQVPGNPDPLARYSDAVHVECAVKTSSGWSPTMTVVPKNADSAAWFLAVTPDETTPNAVKVRWTRDSFFQFLHMTTSARPATDGVQETSVTIQNGALVVGATTQVAGEQFEAAITTPDT